MSDSEKPFACTTAGCNMSFINEDHLTVHKKKHDMMLNLGINNKNFFIADQTPTPTRFIRNCDEVGLFQDLQNDNPFEETFRRAVESGKTGVSVLEVNENDDTLHTPNIFPHITEECTTSITSVSTKSQVTKAGTKSFAESSTNIIQTVSVKEITEEDNTRSNQETIKIIDDTISKEYSTNQIKSNYTVDNSIPKADAHIPISGAEMQLLLKTQDGKVLKFIAAPILETHGESINTQSKEQNAAGTKVNNCNKSVIDPKIIQGHKLSLAKMKLKQTLTKNGTVAVATKAIQNNENENKITGHTKEKSIRIDHSKKQAVLERNRASSMRARAKRKAWIEQLQQSLKTANETNANLQAQVKTLHAQVAKLKTLLLAHKDCPVTKAIEKGSEIVVASKILTIKPNEVKQIPVMVGPIRPTKRARTEKLIVPKKKPLSFSSTKNSIILPKTESAANTITLHGGDALKSISTISIVAPFTNSGSGKTILGFLHPDTGKIPLIQNNISSQNFNENAASKTTGT